MSAGNLSLYAAASVAFTMGVPAYTWQSGEFTGTITDTGTGDVGLNLAADKGIDATACVVLLSMRGALAASGLTTFACAHTTDVIKQVTIVQEAAMGGASVAADVNFDIAILKLSNQ